MEYKMSIRWNIEEIVVDLQTRIQEDSALSVECIWSVVRGL